MRVKVTNKSAIMVRLIRDNPRKYTAAEVLAMSGAARSNFYVKLGQGVFRYSSKVKLAKKKWERSAPTLEMMPLGEFQASVFDRAAAQPAIFED